LGYHIKAHVSLGSIRLGLVNLNYLINNSSMTEAQTIGFDTCPKKVKCVLEASNAPLQIN
jgi:hypothetical protein